MGFPPAANHQRELKFEICHIIFPFPNEGEMIEAILSKLFVLNCMKN